MADISSAFGQGAVIAITIKAVDEFSGTFKKAEEGITGFSKKAEVMATAVVTAGVAAIGIMGDLAKEAAIAEDQTVAFNRVVGVEGPDMLKKMQRATLNTVDKFTLMSTATTAVNRGIKKEFIPTITEFAQRMSDADPQFKDVVGTINDLTTAIATGRTMTLARMGIDVDATTVIEEYAKKTVMATNAQNGMSPSTEILEKQIKAFTSSMNDAQKTTAMQDYIMGELNKKMETLPVSTSDAADKMAQLNAQFKEAKVEIGMALHPAFVALLDSIMPMIPTIKELVLQLTPLLVLILKIAEALLFYLNAGIEAVGVAIKGWGDIINTFFIEPIKQMISWIESLISVLQKAYDLLTRLSGKGTLSPGGQFIPSKKVGDAILRPNGQIIETDPRDTLIATKNPGAIGGGITIYIQNVNGLDPDAVARALQYKLKNVISI